MVGVDRGFGAGRITGENGISAALAADSAKKVGLEHHRKAVAEPAAKNPSDISVGVGGVISDLVGNPLDISVGAGRGVSDPAGTSHGQLTNGTKAEVSHSEPREKKRTKTRFMTGNSCCKEESCPKLNPLTIVPLPGSVCSVSEEEFVQVDMMVDSGATETVMTEKCLEGVIDISEGAAFKRGQHYECANGSQIPNLGERKFLGITEEEGQRAVTAQICAVTKNLLSVHGMT